MKCDHKDITELTELRKSYKAANNPVAELNTSLEAEGNKLNLLNIIGN